MFEDTVEAFVRRWRTCSSSAGSASTKGCYTGQEVVARMQYLGKLKRRIALAHIADTQRPAPGAEVFSPSSESGQGAGRIVDAAPSPDGGFDVLAVLQISSAEAGDVRLHDAAGPVLELRPMRTICHRSATENPLKFWPRFRSVGIETHTGADMLNTAQRADLADGSVPTSKQPDTVAHPPRVALKVRDEVGVRIPTPDHRQMVGNDAALSARCCRLPTARCIAVASRSTRSSRQSRGSA